MPRQGRSGGRAPSRPTVAPSRPSAPAQQTRPSSTTAYPAGKAAPPAPAAQAAAQQQSGGGSMLGNIASTAAGVAIGSSVGHAITGFFSGGSAPAEQSQVAAQDNSAQNSYGQQEQQGQCSGELKNFTKCLDDNNGDMSICNWYLESLKSCKAAAAPY